ncbi:hypothetical protein [Methylovulum psychrotolerans]|uniref:Uncharacterized protein n=1 Tax=Methylovulum psychrotolerans TaxID=1704499 RepID=A0A1Z4C4W1_9GAMM|nr:hypothetical protein [Methylovulum psychrotolerans]ASF48550.1 hypothetical protein CEK71_22205 [Methylovulum psychrotolerans]
MQIKEVFADILQQNIPKYLKLTYNEVKPYLDGSSVFTEIVSLSIDGKETWAQLELNPLYEFYENEELVIRSVFMINN